MVRLELPWNHKWILILPETRYSNEGDMPQTVFLTHHRRCTPTPILRFVQQVAHLSGYLALRCVHALVIPFFWTALLPWAIVGPCLGPRPGCSVNLVSPVSVPISPLLSPTPPDYWSASHVPRAFKLALYSHPGFAGLPTADWFGIQLDSMI